MKSWGRKFIIIIYSTIVLFVAAIVFWKMKMDLEYYIKFATMVSSLVGGFFMVNGGVHFFQSKWNKENKDEEEKDK